MRKPESLPLLVLGAALVAAIAIGSRAPVRAQTGGDQSVTLENVEGRPPGTLRVPATPARPPVVLLMTGSAADSGALAAALSADGIASLRPDGNMVTTEATAQWIALLRNDVRFPTVTVFAEGVPLSAAVIAARAARADGVITRGDTTRAAAEIARLVPKAGTATDTASIAAFARTVPVLGRRGAPTSARPTTARRSPRQVAIGSVGSVRVAIEWGAPQMRARAVWGGLVPWNAIWMPGADEATTLTTDGPLTIGTLDVPAGDYTLYTFPAADRVQLIVSRDVGQFHTVKDESLFLGRVDMTAGTTPGSVEGLTFAIEGRGSSGTLKLMWDTREYSTSIAAKTLLVTQAPLYQRTMRPRSRGV